MHSRSVSILANLWGVQKGETAVGSATTGSSEAIHLGGLAMKRRWQEKREKEGKDKSKPNILMGSNAQVMTLVGSREYVLNIPGRLGKVRPLLRSGSPHSTCQREEPIPSGS